jgi:hypothetical protein
MLAKWNFVMILSNYCQPDENFAGVDETERPDIVHAEEIIVRQRNKMDG